MNRSAVISLLIAVALLPLATAQSNNNSDWNPTDLDDALFLGLVIGGSVLALIMILLITCCCCCMMCPQVFEPCGCNVCGPQPEPYIQPQPQYYPQQPVADPSPYPIVINQPRQQEPIYIRSEPRREEPRVMYIRRERDEGRSYYRDDDYSRRPTRDHRSYRDSYY